MGLFEDIEREVKKGGQNIGNAVTGVVRDIDRAITQPVVNAGNAFFREVKRGDVGRWAVNYVEDAGKFITTPIRVGGELIRGDNAAASREFQRGIGAALNFTSAGAARELGRDGNGFQEWLRSPEARKWTLGLSEDLAGYARGVRTTSEEGYLDNADRNSAIRLGVKSAAIATGAALYQSGALSGTGAAIKGALPTAAGVKTGAQYVAGAGILSKLLSGDKAKVAEAIEESTGWELPDWATDLIPGDRTFDRSQPNINPSLFQNQPSSSTGFSGSAGLGITPVIAIGAVIGAVFLLKKGKI